MTPPSRLSSAAERALPWLLFLATLLVFKPVLGFRFLNWDDGINLTDNPRAWGFTFRNLRWAWTSFHAGHYSPLAWMSYALDFRLWGLDPFGYHLTNLLLHAANAAAVFFLVRRLLSLSLPSAGAGIPWAAALGAAWWAWHPNRVESVAWVTQRRDLLASLFLLTAAWTHLSARTSPSAAVRRRMEGATFLFFILSLFAKAIGAVFPAIMVLLDVYPLHRWEKKMWWEEKKGYWILSAAFLATAALAQVDGGAAAGAGGHPPLHRLMQSFYGLAHAALHTAVPSSPRLVHEFPVPFRPFAAPFLSSAFLAAAAVTGVVLLWKRFPAPAAALGAFAVFLSPTLGLFQSGPQFTASRYTYLASVGPAALLAGMLLVAGRGPRLWAAVAGAILLTAAGAAQARRRLPAWRDSEAFWRAVIVESPRSSLAWNNLGQALLARARWDEALQALDRARENASWSPQRGPVVEAEANRGYIYLRLGRWGEAEASLRRALDMSPGDAEARNNLGLTLMNTGRLEESLREFDRLARSSPDFMEGRIDFGVALARAGRPEAAMAEFRAAAALRPDAAAAPYNMALLLNALGRPEEAARAWEAASRLDPSLPPLSK